MDLFRKGEVRMPGSEETIQGPGKRERRLRVRVRDPRGVGLVSRGFRAGGERLGGGLLAGTMEGCWLVRWKAGRDTDVRLGARARHTHNTEKRQSSGTGAQEHRRQQALTGARLLISHR